MLFPDLVINKELDEDKHNSRRHLNKNSYVYIDLLKKLINDKKIGSGRIRVVWLNTDDMYKKYLNVEQITGNEIFDYIPLKIIPHISARF